MTPGALERFVENARTISVATSGSILKKASGMPRLYRNGITEYDAAMVFVRPKKQSAERDAPRLPLAEHDDGHGEEAIAADAGGIGRGRRQDKHEAAETGQSAGDQDAGIAHLIDADANAVGCLRVFAAAAQAQAEAGTLEDEGRDDQDEDAEIRRDIGLLEQDRAEDRDLAEQRYGVNAECVAEDDLLPCRA